MSITKSLQIFWRSLHLRWSLWVPIFKWVAETWTEVPATHLKIGGPVSLRLMTSQFKDIVSNTQKLKSVKYIFCHDDVIKWKYFPRYWPFVRGIHRSAVNSPHKGQWRGALMFSLICNRINSWVNNGEAGDLRRHRGHYDVIVMRCMGSKFCMKFHTKFWTHTPQNMHFTRR